VSDWVCGRCKSINRDRTATCYSCGGIRGAIQLDMGAAAAAPPSSALGTTSIATPSPEAAATFASGIPIAEVAAPAPAEPASMGDVAGGVIGGAIGAVLATALWYGVVTVTHWQIGWVAVAVGFVVAQGVVLGADEGLSDDLRQSFRASGLYHLLAVSGQNVVLVAGGALAAAWILGLSRVLGQLGALAAIAAYVLAVGPQPSVLRAGIAGALGSIAWLTARAVIRKGTTSINGSSANPIRWMNPRPQIAARRPVSVGRRDPLQSWK